MEPPVLAEDGEHVPTGVRLRPLVAGDAADVDALDADADHRRWCHPGPGGSLTAADGPPLTAPGATGADVVAAAARGWASGGPFVLAVEREGRWAGTAGLHPDGHGAAQLRVSLAPWARGARTGSAAARLLLVWGFAQVGLGVVRWTGEVGDWPGRRMAWACGFAVEGTVRDLLTARDGSRRDGWVASLRWGEPLRPRGPWLVATVLAGRGLRLGPHVAGDVDRVAQACSADSTQAWLPALPAPYTVLDAAAWVSGREECHALATEVSWAVRDDDGRGDASPLLATVSVFHLAPGRRSGEVGYWCHPDARGRGVVTGAVRLVAEHALAPRAAGGLGLDRLDLKAAATNTASRRVAERAGFAQVGVERAGERLRDGTRVDFTCYDRVAGGVAT